MLLAFLYVAVLAYPILQVIALLRAGSGHRLAAAGPLFVMVPLLIYSLIAYAREANLWPLMLLFASPVAVLYLCVFLAMRKKKAVLSPGS